MADEELRYRLAKLIVEALGVGGSKQETRVIQEIFEKLGATVPDSRKQFPSDLLRLVQPYPERVARDLADAAPTADDLINVVVRVGGRFIDMVQEVYARLSRHAATIGGAQAAEKFRFERGGIDEEPLTISPAFIEQWRQFQRTVGQVKTGRIDEDALNSFLVWDGNFYGHWPLRARNSSWDWPTQAETGERLASWVLAMHQSMPALPGPDERAAERLIAAAETLVRARIGRLERLSEDEIDPETATDAESEEEPDGDPFGWTLAADLEFFRQTGVIGLTVDPGRVTGVNGRRVIGLRANLEPVADLIDDTRSAPRTPIGALAAFVAMWRLGLQPVIDQPTREQLLPAEEAARESWLRGYRTACDQATRWLTDDVFRATGTATITQLIEIVTEFLNLPLWRQRELLYEIWVLCATFDACEQAGWTVELNGLTRGNGEWVLSVGRSDTPVATLHHATEPAVTLDVWREPSRREGTQELTPDVTVSTPLPYIQDLLVVEAKDRQKMSVGLRYRLARAEALPPGERTALGTAERYARGLRPRAVWVCNHCDFRQQASAEDNHGNRWTQVHVADQFRPRHVPAAFTESVRAALAPPSMSLPAIQPAETAPAAEADSARTRGFVLVIDVTASMRPRLPDALTVLTSESAGVTYDQFRAVLYSDHGGTEPLLVRKVGPFSELRSLLNAVEPLPAGFGWDTDEALEDAMQRCRELTEDIGPQDLLVLTDAPPHPVGKCPYGIDFEAEVRALLDAGCRIQVASDWYHGSRWNAFEGAAGFQHAPLETLISATARS